MATDVKMPALGESVTEGTVARWLKQVGDTVAADEPILEVSTDKVDSEVPAPCAGTIVEILVEEDDTVEVGAVVCRIGDGAPEATKVEDPVASNSAGSTPAAPPAPVTTPVAPPAPVPAPVAPPAPVAAPVAPVAPPAPVVAPATPLASEGSVGGSYVTPLVRKLAREKDVDLSVVKGTGVGGRIRREDVETAAKATQATNATLSNPAISATSAPVAPTTPAPSGLRGKTEKMSRMRQVISKAMMTSLHSTAQLTTVVEVDVTRIAALRAAAKNSFIQREGTKLTFLPFFIKAAVEALKAHPKINSRVNDETNEVTYFDYENVGIAVDTEKGLMVPVIKNCGDLTIAGIAKHTNELAEKVRTGGITPADMTGGTFTITNTGSRGALFDTPVLNYPEEAILGLGAIVKRPMVIKDSDGNDTIAVRHMVYLALSYDHRLIDGADASRYLSDVKKRLEAGDFATEVGL